MAAPPPAAAPLAIAAPPATARPMGPIATAPRPTASQQAEAGRRAIATAPLPAAARQGRRPNGTAPPSDRPGMIAWLEAKGVILSDREKNGGRNIQLTMPALREMARPY